MADAASGLPLDQDRAVAERVREALARRRLSRQQLADAARISLSTLEKALAGGRPFTLATTLRLEQALGVELRAPPAAAAAAAAPESLGAYSRDAARWLEGAHLTLRPSFEAPGAVFAYLTEIAWDDARSHLVFRETARLDAAFAQSGVVSLPRSGQVYLHTNERGEMRLAVLGRPMIDGTLSGVLTTLQVGGGTQLIPVAAPFVLTPMSRLDFEPAFGRIGAEHALYATYRAHLARVTEGAFARLITP